ncbi:hypothetical protein POKO110462_17600 [Pontibacter korlensis]|uniref:hypothetical protein n=1 Tax=Pontibacter korlensis TaxID=400092 RepID=UPI001F1B2AD7|nr:hypothetical protein [Pontibacter korlensis]
MDKPGSCCFHECRGDLLYPAGEGVDLPNTIAYAAGIGVAILLLLTTMLMLYCRRGSQIKAENAILIGKSVNTASNSGFMSKRPGISMLNSSGKAVFGRLV